MAYKPNLETWPGRIASIVTRARSALQSPDAVLNARGFVDELLRDEGFEGTMVELWNAQDDNAARAAEIEYLAFQAIHQMDRDGEIVPAGGGGGGIAIKDFVVRMGWEGGKQFDPSIPEYRPSARLLSWGKTPWLAFATRWQNVDRLSDQVWRAWQQGLDVAAAVTARVSVEEAIRNSLQDLGATNWETKKAVPREAVLFNSHLTKTAGFEPLDREATRAALSGIRSLGNDAAHTGVVTSAALEEALLQLLGQALMSLSSAVSAQM